LFEKQTYSGSVFSNLFLHFLFIDPLFPKYAYGIISPAWFLTPLIGLYILFPYLNKYLKKYPKLLLIPFIIMIIFRIYSGTFTHFNPLFFIGEFCFGIAFAYNKRIPAILISALTLLIQPLMFVPYLLFYVLCPLKCTFMPSKILDFLGSKTLALFLFHEAFIKVGFGKWKIYNLDIINGLIVLTIVLICVEIISKDIKKIINKEHDTFGKFKFKKNIEKHGKNKN
jgi:peptidoglycan/LPS O-acetylase OafA/YrhL